MLNEATITILCINNMYINETEFIQDMKEKSNSYKNSNFSKNKFTGLYRNKHAIYMYIKLQKK